MENKIKMQITHEEARRLIHLASDEQLKVHQKGMLESHLASCAECKNYADSIHNMESILQPLLQKQWAQRPIPLPIAALISSPNDRSPNINLLATRIAAIGMMFAVFMFSAWQLASLKPNTAGPALPSNPPIPVSSTSTLLISATAQTQTCEKVSYIVQGNDTLASVAYRFSTSKREIMIANTMKSETVIKGTELIIPVCNFTPTGTINPLTTTFTPILRTITSTPGG
jgi:LysM repeat protein